jgi:hypothetical protein
VARRWVFAVAAAALAVRLFAIVALYGDSTDLHIYRYFAEFARHGVNPYHAPASATAGGSRADEPALEFLLFAGLLDLWNSATVIRLLFALLDTGVVLALGLLIPRSPRWRLNAMLFYAFNPLVLLAWTRLPEDKSISFVLIVVAVACFERGRIALGWASATLLAALKWVGAFFALPLLVQTWRKRGAGYAVRTVLLAAAAFLLANLPYFPGSFLAYERRDHRLSFTPIFDSITVPLAHAGLYTSLVPRVWLVVAAVGLAYLTWRRTIDVAEAICIGTWAGFVLLPDEPPDRILIASLPLLLVVRSTRFRWLLWWLVSLVPATWLYVDTMSSPGRLRQLTGAPESWRHVLGANVLMLALVAVYGFDRMTGRGREPIALEGAEDRAHVVVPRVALEHAPTGGLAEP